MALHVPRSGFSQMLKEGTKTYSGIDETVLRNIEATRELLKLVRTCYGPNGLNKIVINHIGKQFITNDAATIIKEIENNHPGIKVIILASQMQETEVGDGTNFVLLLAGFLLDEAESLLSMGLSVSDIVEGYQRASQKALALLPGLVVKEVTDLHDVVEVQNAIKASIMSKQLGYEDFLSRIVAEACTSLLPEDGVQFDVDSVRICKIIGGSLLDSKVIAGMVFKREVESDIISANSAKVACFGCPIDITQTETKGTVLITNAEQLKNYSNQENDLLEGKIRQLKDAGVKVIVAGGKIGDLALHYINKYGLMAVRLTSKWDMRRLAKSINATVQLQLTLPKESDYGTCDTVYLDEIADTSVVVFKHSPERKESQITTIVLRGATESLMNNMERAIDNGVNNFKALTKDGRLLAGAGAVELELAKEMRNFGEKYSGLG